MGPKRQELIEVLAKLADLLEINGGQHWRAWLLRAKARLENSDYSGIEYLLQAYGGMGSFNDFVAPQRAIEGQPTGERRSQKSSATISESVDFQLFGHCLLRRIPSEGLTRPAVEQFGNVV